MCFITIGKDLMIIYGGKDGVADALGDCYTLALEPFQWHRVRKLDRERWQHVPTEQYYIHEGIHILLIYNFSLNLGCTFWRYP